MTSRWQETIEMSNEHAPSVDADAAGNDPVPASEAGRTGDADGMSASRGDLVGLAIQIDALIERAGELNLGMTSYLLGVARADLGERLGERRARAPDRG